MVFRTGAAKESTNQQKSRKNQHELCEPVPDEILPGRLTVMMERPWPYQGIDTEINSHKKCERCEPAHVPSQEQKY